MLLHRNTRANLKNLLMKHPLAENDHPDCDSSPSPKKRGLPIGKFTFLLLVGCGITLYLKRDDWKIYDFFYSSTKATTSDTKPTHVPDPVRYNQLKQELQQQRIGLKRRYLRAKTKAEQDKIIKQSQQLLTLYLPRLMRCWLGHPWDFNGTATIPGKGKIACGYYVSTIMRDAGFKVKRINLAQQPSQRIIKTFVPKKKMWITCGKNYDQYVNTLEANYPGINIIGLDHHVAFVVVEQGKLHFIHSGGLTRSVVDETKSEAYSLKTSNYRVIANISNNRPTILKWLLGKNFPTAH